MHLREQLLHGIHRQLYGELREPILNALRELHYSEPRPRTVEAIVGLEKALKIVSAP